VSPHYTHVVDRAVFPRKPEEIHDRPSSAVALGLVQSFYKTLAKTKSHSTAKQAKTVLSLALGLAVRYDALRENPVRETAKLNKPPSQAKALTVEQVETIRAAAHQWRREPGLCGPPPDGQLEQIIDVMLGTSARIGEVLAIRNATAMSLVRRPPCASAAPSSRPQASRPVASRTPRR
jgi:hypothetical protein